MSSDLLVLPESIITRFVINLTILKYFILDQCQWQSTLYYHIYFPYCSSYIYCS